MEFHEIVSEGPPSKIPVRILDQLTNLLPEIIKKLKSGMSPRAIAIENNIEPAYMVLFLRNNNLENYIRPTSRKKYRNIGSIEKIKPVLNLLLQDIIQTLKDGVNPQNIALKNGIKPAVLYQFLGELLEEISPKQLSFKLDEVILPQYLYHFTHDIDDLAKICYSDRLGLPTSPQISFTRTPLEHPFRHLARVMLALDPEKLRQKYKIHKFIGDFPEFLQDPDIPASDEDVGYPREAEEYIEKPIQPLHIFLKKIVLLLQTPNDRDVDKYLKYLRYCINYSKKYSIELNLIMSESDIEVNHQEAEPILKFCEENNILITKVYNMSDGLRQGVKRAISGKL